MLMTPVCSPSNEVCDISKQGSVAQSSLVGGMATRYCTTVPDVWGKRLDAVKAVTSSHIDVGSLSR
jgi:hypothetical protein